MENHLKRALSLILAYPLLTMAHVEAPHVTAGQATFENPDANTQVIHAADKTAIHCKTFNVKKEETVRFVQPHNKASVLCRVTGKEASIIEGRLDANGRLFLVNPHSIFFRETAQVNVHSLIASTLIIKDEDFVKGNYRFSLDPDAKDSAIVNRGKIVAEQDVVFMAPQIANRAVVKAVAGHVAFLGGDLITLNFEGDNLISFAIDGELKSGFIAQMGQIEAGKGVLLKLRVADAMIKNVVNVNGLVEASSLKNENGKILLVAGSSIAAPKVKVEGPLVQTAGDFIGVTKLEINPEKEMKVLGGSVKPGPGPTEVSFSVPEGMITLDGPFTYLKDPKEPKEKDPKDKDPPKSLNLHAKIIDQNSLIKATGPVTLKADTILLSGNTNAPNTSIKLIGTVIVDGDNVEIKNGYSKGYTLIDGTLDADQSNRSLRISNGKESGIVDVTGPIGSKGPLLELSIETGKLSLHNVGDKNHPGAESLNIKAQTVELLGTFVHAKEQTWEAPIVQLKSGQPTTFITDGASMVFIADSKVALDPQTNVVFETRGGIFELPKLSGEHQQSVTINTGHGDAKIGEFSVKLGSLHVQSQNIQLNGKIEVGSAFMEAQEHICYAVISQVETIPRELLSAGDVTLNAKHGMIGTRELPILVTAKGKIYAGSKSFAYLKGSCADDFPSVYPKNPAPRIVFNDFEIQYLFNEEIFKEEEATMMTLTADLNHVIPHGFVDTKDFSSRRAPIYYQVK
ncbi:MAG TPA: filamentous hemagglutinin N-terminal domain-containing protein [Rhabdochlamydiaceae bacterium]|jgi:filamentous hemagglutinin family protein|nr:filamentous hemagglutinin N-terminal domain-containing protein [Rhabdochlamydiaceae bacterium]